VVYVTYEPHEDPVVVLEDASREHGNKEAFIVVPASLQKRLLPKTRRKSK